MSDVLQAEVLLKGKAVNANVVAAMTDADLTLTIEGASTVSLTLADSRRKLLRAGLFGDRVTLEVDGLLFELVKVAKSGDRLNLTFEDGAVAELRRHYGVKTVAAGVMTRGAFARQLIAEAPFIRAEIFDSGATAMTALNRGSEEDPFQNTWDALGDLVGPVEWRRFAYRNVVYLGTDEWLRTRTPPVMTIKEFTGGVDNIDHDTDVGKPTDSATVTGRIDRWTAAPGQPVEVQDQGLGDGLWVVKEITRSLFSKQASIALVRPQAGLPEPVEPPPSAETADAGTADDFSVPEASGGGPKSVPGGVSKEGYVWPVRGQITGYFGEKRGPSMSIATHHHKGIDIAAPTGTPVLASRTGHVIVAGVEEGYGNVVYVQHEGAHTRYAHLSRILVQNGQHVVQGGRIGLVGSTGESTGPHLHFEIRINQEAVDPGPLLPGYREMPKGWA